jgi:hypothetical protein
VKRNVPPFSLLFSPEISNQGRRRSERIRLLSFIGPLKESGWIFPRDNLFPFERRAEVMAPVFFNTVMKFGGGVSLGVQMFARRFRFGPLSLSDYFGLFLHHAHSHATGE